MWPSPGHITCKLRAWDSLGEVLGKQLGLGNLERERGGKEAQSCFCLARLCSRALMILGRARRAEQKKGKEEVCTPKPSTKSP